MLCFFTSSLHCADLVFMYSTKIIMRSHITYEFMEEFCSLLFVFFLPGGPILHKINLWQGQGKQEFRKNFLAKNCCGNPLPDLIKSGDWGRLSFLILLHQLSRSVIWIALPHVCYLITV